jgi:hypothetical protein
MQKARMNKLLCLLLLIVAGCAKTKEMDTISMEVDTCITAQSRVLSLPDVVTDTLQHDEDVFAFSSLPFSRTVVVSGSGSGVGLVPAFDVFYKTLSNQKLSISVGRKGHTYYSTLKGWNTFNVVENTQINDIKSRLSTTQPAATEFDAWTILYRNVPTPILVTLLRFSSHYAFATQKKFVISEKSESAYIEKIKLLLSQQ